MSQGERVDEQADLDAVLFGDPSEIHYSAFNIAGSWDGDPRMLATTRSQRVQAAMSGVARPVAHYVAESAPVQSGEAPL